METNARKAINTENSILYFSVLRQQPNDQLQIQHRRKNMTRTLKI